MQTANVHEFYHLTQDFCDAIFSVEEMMPGAVFEDLRYADFNQLVTTAKDDKLSVRIPVIAGDGDMDDEGHELPRCFAKLWMQDDAWGFELEGDINRQFEFQMDQSVEYIRAEVQYFLEEIEPEIVYAVTTDEPLAEMVETQPITALMIAKIAEYCTDLYDARYDATDDDYYW